MDLLFVVGVIAGIATMAFWAGRIAQGERIGEAIGRGHAICIVCGEVLPFLADGDRYRCTRHIEKGTLPTLDERARTIKGRGEP